MKFIRSFKRFHPVKPNGKTIVYMSAYGWRMWQSMRQIRVLQKAGFEVIAMDFTLVLHSRNPQDLIDLMDEVAKFYEDEGLISKDTIMVGISIGGLVALNMARRYHKLDKLIAITGGDISRLPTSYSLKRNWKLSREELAELWQDVNMYTPADRVKDKHMVMVLPGRDRVINPDEVRNEVAKLSGDNDVKLVITKGGHLRTIVAETILFPKRSLPLIEELRRL